MDYKSLATISNVPLDEDITPAFSSQRLNQKILFFIFCLVGIIANFLIVYTILKFQRLRTISNILLANWAIADVLSLLASATTSSPRIYRVIGDLEIYTTFDCILLSASMELSSCMITFGILICSNWIVESCFKKHNGTVKKCYLVDIGIVWFINLVLITDGSTECSSSNINHFLLSHIILHIETFIYLCVVVILQLTRAIMKCCKKSIENDGLMLNLTTVFLAWWVLGMMSAIWSNHCFQMIVECLFFSNSLFNLILLYCYNQDFENHLRKVVKCSCHKYQEPRTVSEC